MRGAWNAHTELNGVMSTGMFLAHHHEDVLVESLARQYETKRICVVTSKLPRSDCDMWPLQYLFTFRHWRD